MPKSQASLLNTVKREVALCRPLALKFFRSSRLRVERKPDQSPVTLADKQVEERLRRALAKHCPGETIIGEEFGTTGRQKDSYWTIDPIDGTRAFSKGLPTWCIMVGKVERGKPVLGICDFPALGVTLAVAPGVAAYEQHNNKQLLMKRVNQRVVLSDSVIFHGGARWWHESPHAKGFERLIGKCFLERAYGDCYGFIWLYRGLVDVMIEYGVKVWDMVPLAAMAHATGRVMIGINSKPNWLGPDTIVAHPRLAAEVARILRG